MGNTHKRENSKAPQVAYSKKKGFIYGAKKLKTWNGISLPGEGLQRHPAWGTGKKPAIKWQKYQKQRATEEELTQWFGGDSKLNIAIVTGEKSGIIVVDIDGKAAEDFAEKHLPEPQK